MRNFSKLSFYEVEISQKYLFKNAMVVALCKVDHFDVILRSLLPVFDIKLYLYQFVSLARVDCIDLADAILFK